MTEHDAAVTWFAIGAMLGLAWLLVTITGHQRRSAMTNIIRLSDRLARLEAQRREKVPDLRRLAEASARLIEAADAAVEPDQIRAFQVAIEAARRRVGHDQRSDGSPARDPAQPARGPGRARRASPILGSRRRGHRSGR